MTWFQKLHLSSKKSSVESNDFICGSLIQCTGAIKDGERIREDADMENEIGKQTADLESGNVCSFSALLLSF